MLLPNCVRVDYRDDRSTEVLIADGWREVGILDTYTGEIEGRLRGAHPVDSRQHGALTQNVEAYQFTGRVWRDPRYRPIAPEETRRFIAGTPPERIFVTEAGFGFGIFTRNGESLTLDLIGVVDRNRGIAQDIIRSAIRHFETKWFRTGTYSDNIAARRLYTILGLSLNHSDRVFHKP